MKRNPRQAASTSSLLSIAIAAVCTLGSTTAALAQATNWPERTVRIINPYAAGGPSGTMLNLLAEGLTAELGQRVIVESKPGGGTVIAAQLVARAPADGYTMLLATVAPLVVQPAANATLPYDAQRDFALVGMFATVPNLIAVHPSLPVQSLQQLIEYARQHPGTLDYASAGAGTGPHLGGELFNRMAGVKLNHVPYGGAAPAVLGVLGGQVKVSMVNITPQVAHVKAGKLRALALAGLRRSTLLPDVPTAAEAGLPGYIAESWNGLAAPAGTPRVVIDKLYAAMTRVMATSKAQDTLAALGAERTLADPEAFTAYVQADRERLVPIIRALDLSATK